jgi:hypothetical protein
MPNATVLNFGQVNLSGATDALFLKVYGGEVMAAFEEANRFMDRTMVRNINSGRSAAFPATWKLTAAYHTAGNEILGQTSATNERVILIDDLLVSSAFLARIDEAKTHYEVRSIYSKESGRALAYAMDRNLAQVLINAARSAATVTGGFGGGQLTNANFPTDGATLAAGIFNGAQILDEKDIPTDDRYAMLRPAQYYLLVQTTNVINRDWGGSGVYADGKVLKVAGVSIDKSNHIPSTNIATGPTAYQGNFTPTTGIVFHKSAAGTVKLLDLKVEMEYEIRRQGTLIVASYAAGHGILRPESSVELRAS